MGGPGREKSGISRFREKVPPGPEKARYARVLGATRCQNARVNAISRKKRVHSRVFSRFAPCPRHFFSKFGNSRFASFRAVRGRPGASKTRQGGITKKRRKSRKRAFFEVFAKKSGKASGNVGLQEGRAGVTSWLFPRRATPDFYLSCSSLRWAPPGFCLRWDAPRSIYINSRSTAPWRRYW